MIVRRTKDNFAGRRVCSALSVGLLLLVAVALPASGQTNMSQHNVYQRTRELNLDTRGVSDINFTSDVHTNLSVQCWEQPQFHLVWTIEAVAGEGGANASAKAAEEFAERQVGFDAAAENGVINVRVTADAARFKTEKVARDAANPGGAVLKDTRNGLVWSLNLKVFVPYGLKINSQQFKGVTSFKCGSRNGRGASTPTTRLQLDGRGTVVPDSADALKDERAVSVKSDAAQSLLVKRVEPRYPPLAAETNLHGRVTLTILVGESGAVDKLKVTSGHPLLRDAATRAVASWRFTPLTQDGKVVPFLTTVSVDF